MKLAEVLFLGGPWPKFGSVGIRCLDIATQLGCAYQTGIRTFADIKNIDDYRAFICVRTKLDSESVNRLSSRGRIVWDIIDEIPPRRHIHHYVASTENVRRMFNGIGPITLIPHHHCNFGGSLNAVHNRTLGWVGNIHWYPKLTGIQHEVFDVRGLSRTAIAETYRKIGIGLNIRAERADSEFHIKVNSGIKLINCIGFGIPSISGWEPPYLEIGDGCTIFSTESEICDAVKKLEADEALYQSLRQKCVEQSARFQLSAIVAQYSNLIQNL